MVEESLSHKRILGRSGNTREYVVTSTGRSQAPQKPCSKKFALVCVVYVDHVLYRNCKTRNVTPIVRETVGWLVRQNEEALWLVSDMPAVPSGENSLESGLVLLRKNVLELKEVC